MDWRTKIWLEDICEAVGAFLVMLMMFVLAWLFLLATPDQRSAEADEAAEFYEKQAKETSK